MQQEPAKTYDVYYDMEEELEKDEVPDEIASIWRRMADSYISQEQLDAKGNFLGRYKSRGFRKAYISIYEKAFIGMAESNRAKKVIDISSGYVCLKNAFAEEGTLYLVMNDEEVYRLRHVKKAEEAAYRINEQKRRLEV